MASEAVVDMCIVPSMVGADPLSRRVLCDRSRTALEAINRTSLRIGDYEEFKRAALDPYVAIRDAYNQHREDLIRK